LLYNGCGDVTGTLQSLLLIFIDAASMLMRVSSSQAIYEIVLASVGVREFESFDEEDVEDLKMMMRPAIQVCPHSD
jgi:hypothetical protein